MKHHVPGLADVSRDSRPEIPDGVFLVRVDGAQFRWFIFIADRTRSSRRCGNVGTRVVCGFPSAAVKAEKLPFGKRHGSPGAPFP
jgi:hypothetical protein